MELQQKLLDSLDIEDDLGMVIRSHIVVEQYLNTLIESYVVDLKSFNESELTYKQTYLLAVSFGLNPRFKSLLKALGTIRNGFAHKLRAELTANDANSLYKTLDSQDKETMQRNYKHLSKKFDEPEFGKITPRQKFMYCIVILCAALQTACKSLPKQT